MDINLSATEGNRTVQLRLFKNGKPTKTLVVLAAVELAFDVFVGYAAYRLFKRS